MKRIILLMMVCSVMAACTPVAEQVMDPISYNKPVKVHSNKTAYLVWQQGRDISTVVQADPGPNTGLLGALVFKAVSDHNMKSHPGQYTFHYSKPQQAVFMSSLQDSLIKQKVFRNVQLSSKAPKTLKQNEVLIVVNFKQTRVGAGQYQRNEIVLDTKVTYAGAGHKTLRKTYLVYSTPPTNIFKGKTYVEHQTEVSEKLMAKVIRGLERWYQSKTV